MDYGVHDEPGSQMVIWAPNGTSLKDFNLSLFCSNFRYAGGG
jgi:hypothetical protein